MKITKEHYKILKNMCLPFEDKIRVHRERLEGELKVQNIEIRLAWDLANAAKAMPFICDTLYKYLDDTHITTALRKVVSEIEK